MDTANVKRIIECLDREIERRGVECITPVEAGIVLDRMGLLGDGPGRPGLPLRNLLRAGLIPHAYQKKGKGSRWFIPHS